MAPRRRRVRLDAEAASPGLGEPKQASGNIQKDIAAHCLRDLSECSDYRYYFLLPVEI